MDRWVIGIKSARLNLKSTYQEHARSSDNFTCCFKTARVHARYHTIYDPYSKFYTEKLFSKVTYLRGNTSCGHVYFNRVDFYIFYPLKFKKDTHTTLLPLVELTGIPSSLHSDRAPEIITGKFGSIFQKYRIRRTTIESNSLWKK